MFSVGVQSRPRLSSATAALPDSLGSVEGALFCVVSAAPRLSVKRFERSIDPESESPTLPERGLVSVACVLLTVISLETLLARAAAANSATASKVRNRIRSILRALLHDTVHARAVTRTMWALLPLDGRGRLPAHAQHHPGDPARLSG